MIPFAVTNPILVDVDGNGVIAPAQPMALHPPNASYVPEVEDGHDCHLDALSGGKRAAGPGR